MMTVIGSGFVITNQTRQDTMKSMRNTSMMKPPENINELYQDASYIILTRIVCAASFFAFTGNMHSTREWMYVNDYGSLLIYNKSRSFHLEIPKYAPFKHT